MTSAASTWPDGRCGTTPRTATSGARLHGSESTSCTCTTLCRSCLPPFRCLRGVRGRHSGRPDAAQLPAGVSECGVLSRRQAVHRLCWRTRRGAVGAACVLPRQPRGHWRRRGDAVAPSRRGHLGPQGRRVHRAYGVRAPDLRVGRPSAGRLVVKPHFVEPDPGAGSGTGGYALFVGRLSAEKGVPTLLAAWSRLERRIPLTIVGDGPLAPMVADAAGRLPGVTWLGRRQQADAQRLIGDAAVLDLPVRRVRNVRPGHRRSVCRWDARRRIVGGRCDGARRAPANGPPGEAWRR